MPLQCERQQRRVLLQLIAVASAPLSRLHAAAKASATSDDGDGGDENGDDAASGGTADLVPTEGVKQLVGLLKDGDAVLVHRRLNFWAVGQKIRVCDNGPFILSKDGAPNMNCGAPLDQLKVSCTCLNGFNKRTTTWAFTVRKKTTFSGTPVKNVSPTFKLPVTKLSPMLYLNNATTVKIVGVGPDPEKIEFMPDVRKESGTVYDPVLETGKDSIAKLTSVHFENIDLAAALTNPNFFRANLTDLTLKNCNLRDASTAFAKSLQRTLKTINLANNQLTQIPIDLLSLPNLQSIDLSGNPISNFTLNETQYAAVNALSSFVVGASTGAKESCAGGVEQSAQSVVFCVRNAAPPVEEQTTSGSNTTTYLIIGVVAGSLVVAALLFLFFRKRNTQRREDAFHKATTSRSLPEETMSFDSTGESSHSVSSTLLNDPIIITHRLPYNDVKVATCISRGGFGLVYSGTFNRRRVAIKKIRPELSGEIKHIESFLKEICLMASLSHPRIVEFVGVSWDSLRNLSAVTEFMERGDLRDVLHGAKERNVRLSWESHKARIAMHVAEALTYLHSLSPKVIHRDLKSKNVLLDNEMTAKLSDFGVSRERRFEESHMTAGIGTAFWIAPEVLLGMDYDERADIFSFGVVLSELDTDDYPYWNEKNGSEERGKQQENVILRMVATGALRPEFSASCPESVLRLAGACLDVDPEKRPSAAQIVYALQQQLKTTSLASESSTSSVYST